MQIKDYKNNGLILLAAIFLCGYQVLAKANSSSSQVTAVNKILDQANQAFDAKSYTNAMSLYDKVIAQQPKNLEVIYWASYFSG